MPSAVAEIEMLDVNIDASVPCQMKIRLKRCGFPSAYRVHIECSCGWAGKLFTCALCTEALRSGKCECSHCGGSDYTWKES